MNNFGKYVWHKIFENHLIYLLSSYVNLRNSITISFSYLSIENDIMVTIKTWDANSETTVAMSQPRSPKGHGYDFQIIVNSNGITKITH